VGLSGFEPEFLGPEPKRMDQATPQTHWVFGLIRSEYKNISPFETFNSPTIGFKMEWPIEQMKEGIVGEERAWEGQLHPPLDGRAIMSLWMLASTLFRSRILLAVSSCDAFGWLTFSLPDWDLPYSAMFLEALRSGFSSKPHDLHLNCLPILLPWSMFPHREHLMEVA
jgi:hypothetical protein